MKDNGKEREREFVDLLIRAFGRECIYGSPMLRKSNGQQKELADAMILVPPYAVVFQLKWMHQTAEDLNGPNKEIEQVRLEHKMTEAAKQFKRLNATWRQNSKIELPQVWSRGHTKKYILDLSLVKYFIPVVVVDFEDQQYAVPGARTNVRPIVIKVPDSVRDWGMVHCFLFKDLSSILDDLFTPGDLMTYLRLRERQIVKSKKFLNYSELDFFALYLTKYPDWNCSESSPMLLVEPNYYESLLRNRAEDFSRRRAFFRRSDILDDIVSQMCQCVQDRSLEAFLLNLGRIKGLSALLKKSIAEHIKMNLTRLARANVKTTTQISMGRFASVIFPRTLYLIGVVISESEYMETVKDFLYRRVLSRVVEKEWQSDIQDVFMIVTDLYGRWIYVGSRTIVKKDYDSCLKKEEIEKFRISFEVEPFKASEWSYSNSQKTHVGG